MSYGDWEEGKISARGTMGRGKRGRDVGSRLFSFPIVPRALSIFLLLQYFSLFLLGYSRRFAEERE